MTFGALDACITEESLLQCQHKREGHIQTGRLFLFDSTAKQRVPSVTGESH